MMKLNWRINTNASLLHSAAAIARDATLSDPRIAAAAREPALAMHRTMLQAGLSSDAMWPHLCASACQRNEMTDIVADALANAEPAGRDLAAIQAELIRSAGKLDGNLRAILPALEDELRHRSRPLREQWDARGPGLARSLNGTFNQGVALEQADVFLVHPVLGGGGEIDLKHTALRFEALLANPVPSLPEVVRLSWFLAQLMCQQADQGDAGEHHAVEHTVVDKDLRQTKRGARHWHALATVPATLAAAEAVELAVCNAELVELAITTWCQRPFELSSRSPSETARCVWNWWQARDASATWNQAVSELNQQLWS